MISVETIKELAKEDCFHILFKSTNNKQSLKHTTRSDFSDVKQKNRPLGFCDKSDFTSKNRPLIGNSLKIVLSEEFKHVGIGDCFKGKPTLYILPSNVSLLGI